MSYKLLIIYLSSIQSTMTEYVTIFKPHNNLSNAQDILKSPLVEPEEGTLHMGVNWSVWIQSEIVVVG